MPHKGEHFVSVQAIPATIGGKIDALHTLREAKRGLAEQTKQIDAEIALIEGDLLIQLDAQDLRKSEGTFATASISETVVGRVDDWDAFHAFVRENNAFHLMQRRTSDPAVREQFQLNGANAVPGVVPFVKRSINLRSR